MENCPLDADNSYKYMWKKCPDGGTTIKVERSPKHEESSSGDLEFSQQNELSNSPVAQAQENQSIFSVTHLACQKTHPSFLER